MLKLLVCFVDCEAAKEDTDWKCVYQGPLCLLVHCKEVLAVNVWSSARLTCPTGEPDPLLQEPSVSRTRLSIILTAVLDLVFFFLIHQTAWGSAEQLHMYILVMRALETCLVALQPASRAEGNQWINPLGWTRTRPPGFFPKHGIQQHTRRCEEGSTKLRGETDCCCFFGLRLTTGIPPPFLLSASCFSYPVWGR